MKAPSRTDLLILLKPLQKGRALLRLRLLANGATEDFVLHDVERRVQAIKDDLPELLRVFRIAISPPGTVQLDADRVTAAFHRLNRIAYGMLDRLLEPAYSARTFVMALSALLTPLIVASRRPNGVPPVIELSANDDFPLAWQLPIELFPLNHASDSTVRSRLPSAASPNDFLAFLGMLAVIVRRRRADDGTSRGKTTRTPLNVVAFRGQIKLPGIEAQLSFFRDRTKLFEIGTHTFWPEDDELDEDEAVRELAAIISRAETSKSGSVSRRPVIHFCCHYRAARAASSSELPELGVTDDVGVGITALRGELAQHDLPEAGAAGRPLVFVNACRSASWSRRDDSLLRLLFRRGYSHVIGGETLLPDLVAGEFATRVYTEALRGRPIGEAIWHARRYLLERFNNPGGLLYTLYGSPDIRLH